MRHGSGKCCRCLAVGAAASVLRPLLRHRHAARHRSLRNRKVPATCLTWVVSFAPGLPRITQRGMIWRGARPPALCFLRHPLADGLSLFSLLLLPRLPSLLELRLVGHVAEPALQPTVASSTCEAVEGAGHAIVWMVVAARRGLRSLRVQCRVRAASGLVILLSRVVDVLERILAQTFCLGPLRAHRGEFATGLPKRRRHEEALPP
mmetsp:Transcript_1148/g.3001  ORF Transcript_1148/g.3001 Transcript_1148/m.3001 type:complete len:206 (-) Transcript_1148:69-686(-)